MTATETGDVLNLMTHLSSLECDGSIYFAAAVGVLAWIIAFAGFRIYNLSLGLCGFLGLAAVSGAAGLAWHENYIGESTHQDAKTAIIVVFMVLWGVIGAGVCVKAVEVLHKIIGFVMGAALGFFAVVFLVYALSATVKDVPEEYAGWESYAVVAVGFPAAMLVGYLMRNLIIYVIMAATALLGGFAGTALLSNLVTCNAEADVEPAVWTALSVGIAVAGFMVQYADYTCRADAKETDGAAVLAVVSAV